MRLWSATARSRGLLTRLTAMCRDADGKGDCRRRGTCRVRRRRSAPELALRTERSNIAWRVPGAIALGAVTPATRWGKPDRRHHPDWPSASHSAPPCNECKRNTDCAIACLQNTRFIMDSRPSRYKRREISHSGGKIPDMRLFCVALARGNAGRKVEKSLLEAHRSLDRLDGEACGVRLVYLFTYVYVVVVNKGPPKLWITGVYLNRSTS